MYNIYINFRHDDLYFSNVENFDSTGSSIGFWFHGKHYIINKEYVKYWYYEPCKQENKTNIMENKNGA